MKDVETDSLAIGTLRITLAACASRLGIPCGALLTKTINAIDFVYQSKASYVIYALNFIASGYFWALVIKTIIQ